MYQTMNEMNFDDYEMENMMIWGRFMKLTEIQWIYISLLLL